MNSQLKIKDECSLQVSIYTIKAIKLTSREHVKINCKVIYIVHRLRVENAN